VVKVEKFENTAKNKPKSQYCDQNFLKWAIEVCNQEYAGNMPQFMQVLANPTGSNQESLGGGFL